MRHSTIISVVLAVFFACIHVACAKAQGEDLVINLPTDGAKVPERPIVEGYVKDSNAQVWVIVHPMETGDYWIQPRVTVRNNGLWRVQIYIGRPGSIDVDKHFEIKAVANPNESLSEGDVLGIWPEAQLQSEIIEVIRE